MDSDDTSGDAGAESPALTVLRLLAQEAPPWHFEDLLRETRQSKLTERQLDGLRQATRLALDVRASMDRQRKREAALAALVDAAQEMADSGADILKAVTRRARLLLDFDMTYASLQQPDGSSYVQHTDGETTALSVGLSMDKGMGMGQLAQHRHAPFWSSDYLADDRFPHAPDIDEVVRSEGLRGILAVPMTHGKNTLGALYGATRAVRHFTPDEVSLMRALANLSASAIAAARRQDLADDRATEAEREAARAESLRTRLSSVCEAQTRLMDMVLDGCDLGDVLHTAAEALDGTLCVRDAQGRVPAATGRLPDLSEATTVRALVEAHAGDEPVAVTGSVWATRLGAGMAEPAVLLLETPRELGSTERQLLRAVGQAVALVLQRQSMAAAAGPVRDEYLDDLLSAASQSSRRLSERARRLRIDPAGEHVVLVLRPEGGKPGEASIWAASYAHRHGGIRTVRGECLVLFLPGANASAAARSAAAELSAVLGHPVTGGAAGPTRDLCSVNEVFEEARRCLDTLTALGCAGRTAAAKDLGFLGLLLSDKNDVDGFVSSAVGPVLDYDARRSTDLVGTLEAYFTSGGSPTRAAQLLHVHTNTVMRRLDRIGELLGPSWQDPANALEIQLALRLQRVKGSVHR
ncbi:helix-turn-helix domain-containing protein [Streptomyces mirabilis]|uniref:helix-turn-helix domain-containing protein n=1 Tax=Streptomyces mirabilis TaxID=68239 RepID=UPI0036769A9B